MRKIFAAAVTLMAISTICALAGEQPAAPMVLTGAIPLASVQGRIDHFGFDPHNRLFISALGNNTVEVIDPGAQKVVHTILGVPTPQGVAYSPETNKLFVASAKGKLYIYDGTSFVLITTIDGNNRATINASKVFNPSRRTSVRSILASVALFLSAVPTAFAQNVVRYTATNANVKYLFATAEPVAHLKSGDILDTNTLDCFGNAIKKPGDTLSMVKGDNPLTGPFFVEGAEPGDTLAVKILDLQVDGDTGVGAFAPGFGALNETNYTPMLHAPLPEKIWFYHIDHAANTGTFKALDSDFSVKIPLHPFFGCIGVAPAEGEARSSVVPAEFGGNMDSPEASVGNTVYFPVNAKGALFYIGDGHAAMGDGEIAGTAIEVPLKARVQLSVIKGHAIAWPRFENDNAIMAVGAYRPLDDALRIAFSELVHWIHNDYGLSELDAYELLSQVGKIHLNEMVDPNYVIVASIEKKYLPAKKK